MVNCRKSLTVGLLAVLVTGCFVGLVSADADWLEGYSKRMLFYWQSSGAGQDSFTVYNQTGINQNSQFYLYNQTQSDFEDLRVTLTDGTTALNVWNQSTFNGLNCTVWCDFPTANASYYLYWNNLEAVSAWNISVFETVISGVLAAYPMQETLASDTVKDYSGNGNDGTATDTTITAGKFEGTTARHFNGVGKITVPHSTSLLNLNGNMTIIAYFKESSPADGRLIYKYGAPNNRGFGIFSTTGSKTQYVLWSGTASAPIGTVSNNDAAFHSIVWSYNGSLLKGYNNGAADVSASVTYADYSNTDNLIMGGDYSTHSINGTLSGVYIFNSALSDSDRAAVNSYYPDAFIEAGKVYVRSWLTGNSVSLFGVVESAPVPSVDPDALTADDAVGLAVGLFVVGVGVCVGLVFVVKRRDDE